MSRWGEETSEGEINKGAESSQSQSISCTAHVHDQRATKQSKRAVKRCLRCLVDCCLGNVGYADDDLV